MRRSPKILRMDRRLLILTVGLVLSITVLAVLTAGSAGAAPSSQEVTNDTCLSCHSNESLVKTFPSGEELSLFIDRSKFEEAVHGEEGLNCVDCHQAMAQIPHPEFAAQTIRDAKFQLYTVCKECHLEQYTSTLDSVHQTAIAAGDENAFRIYRAAGQVHAPGDLFL